MEVWSEDLPALQFRIARPTDQLQKVVGFYERGVGLKVISTFNDHDGYDGVMLGLPDHSYHLEFTQHKEGSACPAPTKDNLLVFYIPEKRAVQKIIDRLATMGYFPVEPENPYWSKNGTTIEDPDGWRVVLKNAFGLSDQ